MRLLKVAWITILEVLVNFNDEAHFILVVLRIDKFIVTSTLSVSVGHRSMVEVAI